MSSQGLPISSLLPPLIDGCRYPHELNNPTTIPEDKRPTVLPLLRAFHAAVCSNAATLSEASQTSAPTQSERSAGTSITEMTYTFSVSQEPMQQEGKKTLSPVVRARKHLMRELKACRTHCHTQRVQCKLWHHALRELLLIPHEPDDEAIVEWAIRYDAEPQRLGTTGAISPRIASLVAGGPSEPNEVVMERVNDLLHMSPGIPALYVPSIREGDLLDHSESNSPRPRRSLDIPRANTPLPSAYSTLRNDRMFSFGLRCHSYERAEHLYACEDPGCTEILSLQSLLSHYDSRHGPYERLREPLRMVCPGCDHFHAQPVGQCSRCINTTPVEKVYGQHLPTRATWSSLLQSRALMAGFSGYGPFGLQYPPQSDNTGSTSFRSGGGSNTYNNFWTSSSTNRDRRCHSQPGSIVHGLKQKLWSHIQRFGLIGRIPRLVFRSRRYIITCIAALVLLSISAYERKHGRMFPKLVQILHHVSVVDVPVIGVVLASLAFGVHRFIVHAHRATGPHHGNAGWFSRCAISMFNAACGRPSEGFMGYELGHSRS